MLKKSLNAKMILLIILLLPLKQLLAQNKSMTLWDNRPAQTWMTEAYPLGNGRMGGMVFGGIARERIQFNEISLWTGDEQETGAYQAFGDLYINFQASESNPVAYKRQLDISRAVQEITYSSNNVAYKRQYFCSYPDQVMVMHFTANKKAAYSAVIQLSDAHQSTTSAEGTRIKISGKLPNGLKYQATALLKNVGGTCIAEPDGKGGSQLNLKGADGLTIILSAATDYSNQRAKKWRAEDPAIKVNQAIDIAARKTFQQLMTRHLQDYQSLFGRVALSLGTTAPEIAASATHERLINYKKKQDPELEALLFQYGRYLLISSSRKGGLPANLQGLWNESNNPPWRSDYHSNINIQMNYWLAEPANLSECHFPYLDYINSMREVKKENTQKEYPGVRGWTVKTENNIFGGESFTWNTPGSAWYVQDLWEHYAFTKDKAYLKNFAYPILKEVTMFWDDHLKRRPDGTLVSPMGWSPEHGPTEDGVSYDQQIVYDLFTNYIASADILGIDKTYKDRITTLRANLLQPKIGKWGQLQEWETDRDDPKDTHRHASHLFGLHPGKQFSVSKTPELAKAAKVSLTARGDESTGWSMAWKMNFWARLHDGDHAYTILKNFITLVGGSGVNYDNGGGVYANLFCAHPPFQIDGNLGYTAGIAEMLVQSQTEEIELLPALPKAWANGSAKGLKARGNFELSHLEWRAGKLVKLSLKSLSGGLCKLRSSQKLSGDFQALKTGKDGQDYVYHFNTTAGKTYEFTSAL
ncbi:glycoside hydrolase family 95 protein [Pedobacter sp. MC2016-14]|uniref:glycoside hydrolase family 95 protein n=1 Tax=Pedobacter sp. MC2016-14 TaxID=2897327 RepID=UPI001E6034B6|nr:glycoside hydrolase family 95 protein [Pedobacter sp. MC2016-14]MCD0487244.1 glycoside hydrolase family 95 protein [Pedobacter sp. MC2016-14]